MKRLSIDEVIEHCNKTCDSIKNVSVARGTQIESKQYQEHYQVGEWLTELKKVRQFIEPLRNFNTHNCYLEELKEIIKNEVN